MPALGIEIKRKCPICGESFMAKTIDSWNCSTKCSRIAWKRKKDEELRLQKLDAIAKKMRACKIGASYQGNFSMW